jgi:oligopeptide/dipeptide ABC transporter ATP-binding protein
MSETPILDIRDLTLDIVDGPGATRILDGVSLTMRQGEIHGLVGESGSGKSLTALSIARLVPAPPARYSGKICVAGRDVFKLPQRELQRLRGGEVAYVFQEPGAVLNPAMRVGAQILESLRWHRPGSASEAEVERLLKLVGLPSPAERARQHPHEMSGGMLQRIVIAMALASRPSLLVADEPTTALDVTIQAQILDLLRDLQRQFGMAVLLITHNLSVVAELAGRVSVMYAGQIVESGPVEEVLSAPAHPYTRALLASEPSLDNDADRLQSIPGQPPVPGDFPAGCRFQPRCPQARPDCATAAPALDRITPGRMVRCPYHLAAA